MSTMQRLTLIGMYNYNSKLFDALTLPEQYDKNTFIDSLLIEHGEKLVLYSDIDFMAYAIGAWGRKWSMELTRIAEALQAEYNPIWNYDRYEEADDANNRNKTADSINDNDQTSETTSAGGSTTTTEGSDDRTSETNAETKNTNDTSSTSNSGSSGTNEKDIGLNSATASNDDSEKTTDETASRTSENKADYDVTRENVTDATKEYQISADNASAYQPERKEISNVGKQKETTDGTKDDIKEDNALHREEGSGAQHNEVTSTDTSEKEQTSQNEEVNASQHDDSSTSSEGSTTESGRTSTSTTNADNSGSSTTSHGGGTSNSKEVEDFTSHRGAHMWGNIGVTTSASMVTEIAQQRMKYNLYNTACRLFANELLIGIY